MTRPKPITDPTQGQLSVVISFRCRPLLLDPEQLERQLRGSIVATMSDLADLTVHIRVIGAGGERSEDEGRYDHPSVLANTDDVEHVHTATDVQAKEGRL